MPTRIIVLGGGFAGVYAARNLERMFARRADVAAPCTGRSCSLDSEAGGTEPPAYRTRDDVLALHVRGSPHLRQAGLGHVSEIADAEPPFTPSGYPFQAWSLGELIRLEREVLAPPRGSARSKRELQWV